MLFSPLSLLTGYRTYLVAAAMILAAITQLLGINLPSFDTENAGNLLMEAFAIIFLRKGIKGVIRPFPGKSFI